MNGDVQYDLSTLAFNNGEQLEAFHSIILILRQEITLSEETVSPTRLLLQYMKSLSKIDKLEAFIATNIIYLITFLDNNGKYSVYIGGNIRGIYFFLEIIGSPKTFTTSGQRSHHFGLSFYINNDTEYLHPVIAALRMRHKIIC